MTSYVDIHEGVILETIQSELRLYPSRLEEEIEMKQVRNTDDVGNTPLMSAAKTGNVAVVDFLLSLGANVEAENNFFSHFNKFFHYHNSFPFREVALRCC